MVLVRVPAVLLLFIFWHVYKQFPGGSGGLGEVFSSKLAPVDCKTDRKIDGELLEYGVKFPQKMAANGLRETRKLFINMPVF